MTSESPDQVNTRLHRMGKALSQQSSPLKVPVPAHCLWGVAELCGKKNKLPIGIIKGHTKDPTLGALRMPLGHSPFLLCFLFVPYDGQRPDRTTNLVKKGQQWLNIRPEQHHWDTYHPSNEDRSLQSASNSQIVVGKAPLPNWGQKFSHCLQSPA